MHDPCARWRDLLHCDLIVGRSPALAAVLAEAYAASRCDLPVLLLGETGTGKNLLARAVHDASLRAERPFVTVACNTVPDSLFEARLFGAQKGAYTDAVQSTGLVEGAEGGTLFIDEIGELPLVVQSKLLTLIQFGTWSPLGSTKERTANVRVIAATNAPVSALREDIYFRLGAFEIRMPSLADRVADVPLLAESIIARYSRQRREPRLPLSSGAVRALIGREWRGNIRALENVVRRGLERAWTEGAGMLDACHFDGAGPRPPPPSRPGLWEQLEAYEGWLVDAALAATGGKVAAAAARLGVSDSWLYKHLSERLRLPAA